MPHYVEIATVIAAQPLAGHLAVLHLDLPAIAAQARPGQFVMVQCADPGQPAFDPFLPRPYFVFAADRAAGRVSLLVARHGRGSAWLAGRRDGDRIRVHGPAGREIRPARPTRHLLLLADSTIALAGLAFLAADASRRGVSITLVENAAPDSPATPPDLLPYDVEFRTTTPEAGGLLGTLPELLRWADEAIVAAAPPLLETLASLRRARLEPFLLHAGLPIQALPMLMPAIEPMPVPALSASPSDSAGFAPAGSQVYRALGVPSVLPCGTGVCGACELGTRAGRRLFCRDGPAFPLEDLRWDPAPGEEPISD